MRRGQRLSLAGLEPIPDGSQRDPLQDRAEPISQPGGASRKTYLRLGKMPDST